MNAPRERLLALDAMRGLVMVLMAIDHASEEFNAGRLMTDTVLFYKAGTVLDPAQFFTRWLTHLCAPTFVFLAGTALAISAASRASTDSPGQIDRHIATRGVVLIVIEFAWMSWVMMGPGKYLFQVMWALGSSLLLMVGLRRLPPVALLALGLSIVLGGELLVGLGLSLGWNQHLVPAALLTAGRFDGVVAAYPTLSWLALMCLGWAFGEQLQRWKRDGAPVAARAMRLLLVAGVSALALFAVVRGLNGYGNMQLVRDDASWVQWLHVSKYPPSLTYDALELGLMALLLAGFFALGDRLQAIGFKPLLTLGKTALFFYVLHIHVMALAAWAFGIEKAFGVASSYVGAIAIVVLLLPLCAWWGRFKAAHPRSIAQYI